MAGQRRDPDPTIDTCHCCALTLPAPGCPCPSTWSARPANACVVRQYSAGIIAAIITTHHAATPKNTPTMNTIMCAAALDCRPTSTKTVTNTVTAASTASAGTGIFGTAPVPCEAHHRATPAAANTHHNPATSPTATMAITAQPAALIWKCPVP